MERYFFKIAYKGTRYHGWQRQKNVDSVQESIETALSNVSKTKISVIGCGRTDAGVHASEYFFHINVRNMPKANMVYILNKELPDDITAFDCFRVGYNIHAQFSAEERSYTYRIHTHKDPFKSELSAYYDLNNLKPELVQEATAALIGDKDFKAFCLRAEKHKSTRCSVRSASFNQVGNGTYEFRITADHFLRGMVRIIVGKLLELGQNRMSQEEFRMHLETGRAFKFINQAYPQGLYLSHIRYPFLKY